ncbi:uncharacterized protein SOCEGT47_069160 [Sorangium cellulosum]|uniref:NodB homology domain-containing protein n=1 Tax=Sorangium cellulosum TaxID=56 RepID=A0A4P2Q9T4_SORCE|nr:polysaccharide deacetylase family protein [Sorangium cellulosum]AUX26355.1 uncharacterized protein SOCEGT47_069160 [Sorangium cellulosum]
MLGQACSSAPSGGPDGGGAGAAPGGATASGGGTEGAGGGPIVDEAPRFAIEGVTTWRHGASAAYTLIHDDTCGAGLDNQLSVAAPALGQRGLRASFGAIVQSCVERDLWDALRELLAQGHEIVNHSFSHPDLTMPPVDLAVEIDGARATLEAELSGYGITFFVFPLDAFNDELVDHLRAQGYLGARAGARGVNPPDYEDDLRIRFDVFGPGYSVYAGAAGTPCAAVAPGDEAGGASPACRQYILDQLVEDAIAAGGWGVRELHSVAGEAWEPVPIDEYEAHLDRVRDRIDAGALWMDTASAVLRYRRAREACPPPVVRGDRLLFAPPSGRCAAYATPLTWIVKPLAGAPTALSAIQDGAPLDTRAVGDGRFLVDADPAGGAVTLSAQ